MSDKESKIEKAGYNFGKYFLGPIVLGAILILILAFPICQLWNNVLCDVFPLFNPISYGQSAGLCTLVWSFGVIWRGGSNGNIQ